jgi:hypothetical protein
VGKDTITLMAFIKRVDKCMGKNNWSEQVAFNNLYLALTGSAKQWVNSTLSFKQFATVQNTWARYKPLFKCKFTTQNDDELIVDGLANYEMK